MSTTDSKSRAIIRATLLVLSVCVLGVFSLQPGIGAAAQGTIIAVTPGQTQVGAGQTAAVDVRIENVHRLYGYDIRLSFDPTVVEILDGDPASGGVQVRPGDLLSLDMVLRNVVDNKEGTIWFALTQLLPSQEKTGTGVAFTILLRGLLQGGATPLTITYQKLADSDGQAITASTSSGQVNVVGVAEAPPTPTEAPPPPQPLVPMPTSTPEAPATSGPTTAPPTLTPVETTAVPQATEPVPVPTATPPQDMPSPQPSAVEPAATPFVASPTVAVVSAATARPSPPTLPPTTVIVPTVVGQSEEIAPVLDSAARLEGPGVEGSPAVQGQTTRVQTVLVVGISLLAIASILALLGWLLWRRSERAS